MTFVTETHSGNDTLKLALSASVYNLVQRFDDWRTYRRTVSELRSLSMSQLADLGLHAGDIRRAAREAVYGIRG